MSLWPAIVRSVDRARREIRVEIPTLTDGADEFPLAEINYPIGDKSVDTEIRIAEGDEVNIEFRGGDPRYPIIMGYRPRHVGNEVGTRRWAHDNFELTADEVYKLVAGTKIEKIVGAASIVIEDGKITLTAGGSTIVMDNSGITLNGSRIDINP